MTAALKKFLAGYVNLSSAEMDSIVSKFKEKTVKKNEYLLREEQVCKDLIFVEEGCLRLYYVADGVEVSVWFSFKHSSAIEISSFLSGKPTNYFLQAIEDSEILFLPKTELNKLYHSQPKVQEMMRLFLEDVVLNLIDRFTALQRDAAEKRYKNLLKKPAYLQKVPQKYLASFIGVTPTSLSRIRRKIK
ncbi:MAG: Crp/Fnr family transcriptional regulator [Chitinophagales bacterium]